MSRILNKINDMLIQKFPDATKVEIEKEEDGMFTKVTYISRTKAEIIKTLNGTPIEENIIKEED